MPHATSPREYGLRLQAAKTFYKRHQEGQLSNDPAQQYQFELGKSVAERPDHFQRKDMTGSPNVTAIDQEVGSRLIANGACNKEAYQKVLNKHSPNAGIQQLPQRREQYSKDVANLSDKMVNNPKFKESRSKHQEQPGRAKSSLEDRSKRKSLVKQKRPTTIQYAHQHGRER